MKPMWVFAAAAAVLFTRAVGLAPVTAADPNGYSYPFSCNRDSLTGDFAARDAIPHTDVTPSDWYRTDKGRYPGGGWGPAAAALPAVPVPADAGCGGDTWRRERIVSAAMHYLNIPGNPQALLYRHHHIPDWDPVTPTGPPGMDGAGDVDGQSAEAWGPGHGLDCSNFTAWVYNYGLGINFGGDVGRQWSGTAGQMGRQIGPQGPFLPGDLVYLHPDGSTERASHVVIVLDDQRVIDSRLNAQGVSGVQVRQWQGWYRTAVLGGWRPIAT
jgi:hypothetical protein